MNGIDMRPTSPTQIARVRREARRRPTQLRSHWGFTAPAESDDQQQAVLAPDNDPAPLGDAATGAELAREQHGEDDEVEAELGLDEDDEECGQGGGQDERPVHGPY